MYFPALEQLSYYRIMKDFIEEFDAWLASLPKNAKDRISIEKVSNTFGVPYDIVQSVFVECCRVNLFEEVYALRCPECEFTLKLSDTQHLYNDVASIHSCYECGNEDIHITPKDIGILYKLVKEPDRKFIVKKTKSSSFQNFTRNNLDQSLQKEPNKIHCFFYAPKAEGYAQLKQLYDDLDKNFDNSTAKGATLNLFIATLFAYVHSFKVSTTVHNSTTQLDCCIENTFNCTPSIFNIIGHLFIIECKNEKKPADNTYFKKLSDTMDTMDVRFGIIASRRKWTASCDRLAVAKRLQHKRYIVNLCDEDYESLVNNEANLLDILLDKIVALQTCSP